MIAVALALAVSGCQRDQTQPRITEIVYGHDVCAECGSVIKDPRFAAQYVGADGKRKLFDDPGCLFRSLRDQASPPKRVFLHAYDGDAWIAAEHAWLATTPQTKSPQGYGWAAFDSFGTAQAAVTSAGNGRLLPYSQAKAAIGIEAVDD
jgi:copper chaperone NosL